MSVDTIGQAVVIFPLVRGPTVSREAKRMFLSWSRITVMSMHEFSTEDLGTWGRKRAFRVVG
jgi:hypothetical protein